VTTTEQITTQDDVRTAWSAFVTAAQKGPGGAILEAFRDYLHTRQDATADWQEFRTRPAHEPRWPDDNERRALHEEYRTLTGILQGAGSGAYGGTVAAPGSTTSAALAERVTKYRAAVAAFNTATADYAAFWSRPTPAVPQENPQGIAPPSPVEAPQSPVRNPPLHMPWPTDFSEALTVALTAG
jgi:hypothetical protein